MAVSWQESEVIENLFVGDLQDAQRFDGMIINVLPDVLDGEPAHAIHMPFLAKGVETLEATAALTYRRPDSTVRTAFINSSGALSLER